MNASVSTGLVLAGAVAKGAYEAGAVSACLEHGVAFRRIAGTSSGALNAAVLAAGVATGRVGFAVRLMEETWRDHAAWHDAVEFSPRALVELEGLGSVNRMRTRLRETIEKVLRATEPRDRPPSNVEFRFIGTDLGSMKATHEVPFSFRADDFESDDGRDAIALAAVASGAFPGLFAPVDVGGRFITDGGVTNNSALSYLLGAPDVERAIVVTTSAPRAVPMTEPPSGTTLLAEIVDIFIGERLARDIRLTERANARLARVRAALDGVPNRDAVLEALGLRPIEVVEIGPTQDLEGSPFSGLFSEALRANYLALGKARARAVLGVEREGEGT